MPALGHMPVIHEGAQVRGSTLGRYVEIGADTRLLDTQMGDYSYTDRGADIAYSQIGKFANIASYARIAPGNHPAWRASLHHFQYRASSYWPDATDEDAFFAWRAEHGCTIGHDTWIGHQAIILPGRDIGTGAVVGAGAVVAKDVAPYMIVAGNPARVIRPRFEPGVAERLQALAWWDWPHDRLQGALDDFRSLGVEAFLEKHDG